MAVSVDVGMCVRERQTHRQTLTCSPPPGKHLDPTQFKQALSLSELKLSPDEVRGVRGLGLRC